MFLKATLAQSCRDCGLFRKWTNGENRTDYSVDSWRYSVTHLLTAFSQPRLFSTLSKWSIICVMIRAGCCHRGMSGGGAEWGVLFLETPGKDRHRKGVPMCERLRRASLLRNKRDQRRNGLVPSAFASRQRIEKKNRASMAEPSSSSSSSS